ncbi:MAG: phosphatidate cytidylyltransferase [Pseudobdellovibrionaceae bacterium]
MTTKNNFLTRVVSAVVALAIIIGTYSFWEINGLKLLIGITTIVGTTELANILFHNENSRLLKYLFIVFSFLVFAISIISLSSGSLVYALSLIVMISVALLSFHKQGNLQHIISFQSKASLGFFYLGLLPSFAFKILDQKQGFFWFIFLLAVVFAGDVFAYVFGVLLGKDKMMPSISPKKTWQGSVGGILGSLGASIVCWFLMFQNNSLMITILLGSVSGCFGQFGDFFESLLKRVAGVKDSGKIMPGHGGILDRIDGVLFASPVILAGVLILSHFSL